MFDRSLADRIPQPRLLYHWIRQGRTGILLVLLVIPPGCATSLPGVPPASPAEIPALESAMRDRPDDPDIVIRLGAAYLEAERSDDALRLLSRGGQLRPDDPAAQLLLGLALERGGAWDEAAARYQAVLAAGNAGDLQRQVENRLSLVRRRSLEAEIASALGREAELAATAPRAGTVAVFPLQFGSGDPEFRPLGRAFAELLVTGLARVDRVTVLERQRVQLLLDEIALGDEGIADPATAARSGRLLGAARIVQGRLDVPDENSLEILASVVPVGTEGPPPTPPYADRSGLRQFYELQERVLLNLFESLGVELTSVERDRATQRPTESLQALLAFGRGLEAEDEGDFAAAAEAFQEAAALDAGFSEAAQGAGRNQGLADLWASPPPGTGVTTGISGLPGPMRDPGAEWGIEARSGGGIPRGLGTPVERDPAQELLDQDRIGSVTVILDILLRRPGG